MTTAGLTLLTVVGLVILAILVEVRLKRGKKRPLAAQFARRTATPELGMEATDVEHLEKALRRNDALAAKTGAGGRSASCTAVGASSAAEHSNAGDNQSRQV